MKVKVLITAALTVLFAVGAMFVYSASFAVKQRAAILVNVKGTVKVNSTAGWVAAAERMELREGDQVKTEGGSSAIIRMDDGSMVKVGPLSSMKVSTLSQKGGDNKTALNISNGKAWSRVKKLTSDSDFSVKTPTAVAGVRGTYFSAESAQASTFDVFEGSVSVSGIKSPSDSVLVGANQRSVVSANQKPAAPVALPADAAQEGKTGFSTEEFTSATFDLQISISPQVVEPGQPATVHIQVFKGGKPLNEEVKIGLTLSGSATFVSSGSNQADVTTNGQGAASLDITSQEKESVTVSAQMSIKVKK
jgi:ferric-dicitrate binding protein FerR (iron transport regulator)